MAEKGKRAGIGAGLFGGAGLMAAYGVGCLIAAAILGLALVVSAWLAAVLVGAGLLLIAAVAGLIGKKQVGRATPPVPAEAVEGIKQDVHTLKPGSSS
jgi:membrane protein